MGMPATPAASLPVARIKPLKQIVGTGARESYAAAIAVRAPDAVLRLAPWPP
jgi:hypothetical protein